LEKNVSPEKTENPDISLIEPQKEFTPVVPAWIKNNASGGQIMRLMMIHLLMALNF